MWKRGSKRSNPCAEILNHAKSLSDNSESKGLCPNFLDVSMGLCRTENTEPTTALAIVNPHLLTPAEERAFSILSQIGSISKKLKTLEADIRLLWLDFDNLNTGETILGCATKKQFCERKLHRTPQAVRYMLNPELRESKHCLPTASAPTELEPTSTPVKPSSTVQLRDWLSTKYKAFQLKTSEQAIAGIGGRMGRYDLALFNLTSAQVKQIGELLGKQS